nr:MAG TPA: hypothetical protein [Caudoviricetes sp.]
MKTHERAAREKHRPAGKGHAGSQQQAQRYSRK